MSEFRPNCSQCEKSLKCCDFQPFVPNYILGQLLLEGFHLPYPIEHSYTPLGLIPAQSFRERIEQIPPEKRSSDLACAFYLSKACSIHHLRPSECSSYWCEGMNNSDAKLAETGFDLETSRAQKALVALGFTIEQVWAQIDMLNLDSEVKAIPMAEAEKIYREAYNWASQEIRGRVGIAHVSD